MSLPKITVTMREIDPTWKPIYGDGSPKAINADTMYKDYDLEVEIVQLNLNTGGMRVRYEWPSKHTKRGYEIRSRDISIEHFYKHYEIREKV